MKGLTMIRRLIVSLFILSFVGGLAVCGDTWEGAKKDTSQNLKATGNALEHAGDKVDK